MSDLDDLLGDEWPDPAPPKNPPRAAPPPAAPVAAPPETGDDGEPLPALPHPIAFRKPVGVTFIAEVLGKAPRSLYARLARCPVKEYHRIGAKEYPLYDFIEALSYLIQPQGNIEEWFSSKNAASLPPYVNKMFWDSAHQRNRVMRSSNDLWHTEDVLVVMGRAAMTIKEETRMWIEDLPEKDILTGQQYSALIDATNRLNDQIREIMVTLPTQSQTRASMAVTIDDELNGAGGMPLEDRGEE